MKEGRGRRLFPGRARSEPAAAQGHGPAAARRRPADRGRFARLSPDAALDRAGHALRQGDRSQVVTHIEVLPARAADGARRRRSRSSSSPTTATARREDVTRTTQFDSNDTEMAEVSVTGLVTTGQLTGSVAVMARYQGHVGVFRATIPLGVQDRQAAAGEELRRRAGLQEAEGARACRRRRSATTRRSCAASAVDLAGRLPTLEESRAVPGRPGAEQARKARSTGCSTAPTTPTTSPTSGPPSCATSGGRTSRRRATFAFHDWIRESLHENKPYDQFVREILTATGDAGPEPAGRLVSRGEGSRRRRSKTRPSCSSACGFSAPAAITIRSRSGASRTTTASRRSSAQVGRKRGEVQNEERIFHKPRRGHGPESQDGPEREADRPGRHAAGACRRATTRGTRWPTGWRRRTTRSSPARWSTATGSTSSAAAWSIPKTTCG